MTPDEIEKQRVRGQVACVVKSAAAALQEPCNARAHLIDAQRALDSALGSESGHSIHRQEKS